MENAADQDAKRHTSPLLMASSISSSSSSNSSSKRQRGSDGSAALSDGAIPAEFEAPVLRPSLATPIGTVFTRRLNKPDGSAFQPNNIYGLDGDPLSDDIYLSTGAGLFRVAPTGAVTLLAGSWDNNERGDVDAVGPAARFRLANGVAASPDGTMLFFCDADAHKIKCLVLATGEVRTVAGSGAQGDADGAGAAAEFNWPTGITISPDGRSLFLTELGSSKVRAIDVVTGTVRTVAGSGEEGGADGVGAAAEFYYPAGITISPDGRTLFVVDQENHTVRAIDVVTGMVRTVAGSGDQGSADGVGAAAEFSIPMGITISPDGRTLFISAFGSEKVRQIDIATATVRTVAGSGEDGNADGVGAAAQFNSPDAIMLSSDGATLTVSSKSDCGGHCILRTIAVAPPPAQLPEIVIPLSTLAEDFGRTVGDGTLPTGMVTFVVGPAKRRIEHISKCILCVRSEYFSRMFRSSLAEGTGADDETKMEEEAGDKSKKKKKKKKEQEIKVPDTTPEAFRTLITYLTTDKVDVDPKQHMQHAYDVIKLADKYDVERLGLLVTKAMGEAIRGDTAVPFLEAAQTMGDARLFGQCRSWIAEKPGEVRRSGGVEQLTDLGAAKGLLADSMDEVVRLKGRLGE